MWPRQHHPVQHFHVESKSQEVKETQSISESQNYNQSILENPKVQNLEPEVSNKEENIFNEDIHKEDWIEGEENLHRPPQKEKNQGDAEL